MMILKVAAFVSTLAATVAFAVANQPIPAALFGFSSGVWFSIAGTEVFG